MRVFLLLFVTAVLAMATAAENYDVTLFQPSRVGGEELQPGDYKVVVDGARVRIIKGKKVRAEAEVKVESGDSEFKSTTVRYKNGDGTYRISEIRLGGTSTTLVFN
mgnify:CR=1 FL=1